VLPKKKKLVLEAKKRFYAGVGLSSSRERIARRRGKVAGAEKLRKKETKKKRMGGR